MMNLELVTLGMRAGGLYWLLSGLFVFLPVWLELALPLWGDPDRFSEFILRSLFAAACGLLPGGTALATAAVLRGRAGLGQPLGEMDETCPVLVVSGESL